MSVTVVTCYYKFPSKHSHDEYNKWMNNFLQNIGCNLIIFTSPELVDFIKEKRKDFADKTIIIEEKLEENDIFKKYQDKWDYQYSIDKLKYCGRTPNCYVVWNSKLTYLKKAIELNPFKSDKFVWTDIGCLRNLDPIVLNKIKDYPKYERISDDKLDIVVISTISNKKQEYFQDEVHFAGAMFGGKIENIMKVHDLFYQRMDQFINENKFIGCDQQTIASIYNLKPELFNPIIPHNSFVDIWFYLWQLYSS